MSSARPISRWSAWPSVFRSLFAREKTMYGLRVGLLRKGLISCLLAMPMPGSTTAMATDAPAQATTAAPPSDADLAGTQCVIGEERFLPADYYYCLGTQTYGEQHYDYAKKFFDRAAGWGSKPAQYVLGIMALDGDHQSVNRPLALAWMTLASERPNSNFKAPHDALFAATSVDERKAAERLLLAMRPIYADATAAVRGEKRYAQGMAALSRMDTGNGNYCMEGMATLARPAGDPATCPPVQTVVKQLDRTAATVFDGWSGHVSVGPLQQVDGSVGAKKGGG
jgi:hypothetical protein